VKIINNIFWVFLFFCVVSFNYGDEKTDQVDQLLAKWNKSGSPGCALAIVKDGKIIYKKGYGMANIELDVPITPKSCFYIGSVSKQFVAASVVLLESQGKLSLDDNIGKYFPTMPDYGIPITIRHLIHHTSGIRDYLELMGLAGLDLNYFHKGEDVIQLLSRQKQLNFKPGDRHLYSNSGYLMLAEIVRLSSGKSLRQFAEENIFKPLGMNNSRFHDDFSKILPQRASGYFTNEKGGYKNFISTFDLVGSGGLYTTIEDLFLWDQNFYHHKVGGKEFLTKIHTKGVLNNKEEINYAFGLVHGEYKALKTVAHGGALGGYRSFLVRFPKQSFSLICLSNYSGFNPGSICYKIADIYLKDHLKKSPIQKSEKKSPKVIKLSRKYLENKCGSYRNPENGLVLTIEVQDRGLLYRVDEWKMVLAPISKTKFRVVEPKMDSIVEFKRKNPKLPFTVYTKHKGRDPILYKPVTLPVATREYLGQYVGDFICEELASKYRLKLDGDQLVINTLQKFKGGNWLPLNPKIKDEFTVSGVLVQFLRNEKGEITGAHLSTSRIKNLKMVKLNEPLQ
jgi:CubicO group peptidase (beta-lactamase class C family)